MNPDVTRLLLVGVLLAGCVHRSERVDTLPGDGSGVPAPRDPSTPDGLFFVDVTRQARIDFTRDNGFDGVHYRIIETVNGGLALLDFDGDGFLDIYFTNGARIDPGSAPDGQPAKRPTNALFRNLGNGTFEDVSKRSNTDDSLLSLGCAVADITGDGLPDLYVTNLGPNRLYRNNGDGSFTDIARESGVALDSADAGSVFFDMDADGDLDLYVTSYVTEEREGKPPIIVGGVKTYGSPLHYPLAPDHLLENKGEGRFVDVSESSGIRSPASAAGLGVIAADLNGDGHKDLYVANDATANFLFIGDGKGHFVEEALLHGVAYSGVGSRQGSMGIAVADYDNDGLTDIGVTNFNSEYNNLFRAVDRGFFEDVAQDSVFGRGNLQEVGWGIGFVDFDNDGWRDVLLVNGHIRPRARELDEGESYAQSARLFRNLSAGKLEDQTTTAGADFSKPRVARGSAFGDLDNDGDVDVVICNASGLPTLLRNDSRPSGNWARVRLIGRAPNRDGIGAEVTVVTSARPARQTASRHSSESYLSVNDPRLHFGLGSAQGIERLEVRWPDGSTQVHGRLPARRLITVRQGEKGCGVSELK